MEHNNNANQGARPMRTAIMKPATKQSLAESGKLTVRDRVVRMESDDVVGYIADCKEAHECWGTVSKMVGLYIAEATRRGLRYEAPAYCTDEDIRAALVLHLAAINK